MKARISRKFFCLLLTVVMVCTLLPISALAAGPSGSIESAGITHAGGYLKNAVSVGLKDVTFAESVAVELYSGDTLLTTATLQGVNPGSYGFLTCCIATETADEYWSLTPWTPKDDVVPDKAVLVVDGHELNTKTFTLDADEWANLPGTVLPNSGSIERVGITQAGGNLKNAVSVDLKNVNFKSSVQVQLYSGDTLLTTATLKGVKPGSYGFLTCCIATETADANWALTPWTPKDNVVPDTAVLFVDGQEQDTKIFTLDADEWANLPGTVLPNSGSIERVGITHANDVLKNAVSVDLKNVNFKSSVQVQLYSGDTLLTTATLKGVKPGSYGFLTCCIATETADANWALTPWTPKDNVVPDTAVLFVDGQEQDTKIFTLDADEWANLPGTVLPNSGSIERVGITHDNGVLKNAVSVELKNVNFESSVEVKLYSGDTLLTTATLQGVTPGSYGFLTCCIATETADANWALTPWTPKDNVVPDTAVLFVDGQEQDTKIFTLDADEWANLPGTVLPNSGSIERVGITHDNGVLKNAVSVELKNVNFESSVEVKLYSGDTLLTTATLQGVTPGSYGFLTCCIATETADANWALTPWTPKDNIVPNKAVLFVDGHKLDEKTFTLNAEDWANLPGTAFPSSGSINGAVITQNAVSVELENVNFKSSVEVQLYSDKALLTTAKLNTDKLGAGSYPFVTCCIPTEGEDDAWSLTPWTPKDNIVPNKAVLFVDGHKLDEKTFTLNAEDWANLPGTAFPSSGSINGAVITQNAVSVELENVNFKSSVEVQLYSDKALLTTAKLNTDKLGAGSYPFVTCCIPTEGEDDAWSLTPWTPKDNIVPNKAVLFVDGHKLDEKTFTLNAEDWANLPGTAFPSSGSVNGAVITQNAVSVELENVNFKSSVEVKLYSGDTLLTTATLQGVTPGSYGFLTCCIATETADANWALTPWTPKDNIVPNKAVLFVDGHEQDTKTFTLDADEWAALPGTAFPYSGSIERAGITHANGVLKNAVSVDLKNVNFESSVEVKLYSGDTLLTTATLQGVTPGSYGFLTCCIATETADANWALTPWTPKDNIVPNKAVLFVDGHEQDTKTFTLDADEWAALPGTAFPYSGSIERAGITHANGVLKNAVSVDLKNVNFESSVEVKLYSGDTLLTTATLQGVTPGSYGFLTCCIATETADANWALTPWTPKDNIVPNKAVLFVDGHEQDTKTFTLDADEWAALPGTAFPYSGSIERAGITHANGVLKNAVSVDLKNVNFESSVEVKLYSGDTLLTTATLQGVTPGSYGFLTCCIATETADANWALTPWTPKDNIVPNKAVLFVDGHEQDTKTFTLDADEWAALPGTAFPYSGSIERAGITHANGVLKNAVSVDLKNVNFESSVEVKLYSGDTLLTTATLQGVTPGSYGFLTCCIATETADANWALTPWTPKDNIVPNKAVLFVDGHEQDTKTFTLDADEWAALPGTAFPYSGSIERAGITHANGVLKNAVSVDLKNVNFESSVEVKLYSGDTLLTTATLQGVTPGSYGFLTCCIATETADANWALTPWTPKDNIVPNKAVLFVDGHEQDTKTFTLDADEWAALPGTAFPYSGSIERAGITHANGVLKNAVSVDLKNVNFESSVEVKLYSGDTLLTTATLQGVTPGSYGFLTCCIATETADANWALTPWTPKDNIVPNKAVLFVDGHEQDTKTFTLDADEWAALPGTAFPYSGSIERAGITHANGVLKNAVSVDLKNVNFESSVEVKLYSGDTLLTTATLQGVTPGSYGFLTCCIATETADANWALTPWTPKDNIVPNKAVLFVDGHEQDTKTFTLDADEWAALPGTAFPYSGSIERAGITHANGVLKNAVSVDLKNVNFESSVEVKLYSGDTLLTTATLQGVTPGSYGFLTCCIATETADANWALTPWTPKDNIVPNKAVLFVDGHEQDTKTFTLDADEWAALPGTAFPYSGSIGGGYTYYTIKATAGVNGSISPTGNVSVREGRDQTFTITPNKGYAVAKVLIDSKNVGAVKSYTFENVKKNHTIEVVFMKASGNPQTGVFVDVPEGSYYEEAVNWAVEKGITTGTDATHFSPDGICTRAQAVTFLWRAAGSPAAKSAVMPFADVKVGSYYYDAVLWAVENGITKGTSETMFSPDATCSRAQIVTFLWRSQKSPAAGTANPFTDVKASAYYADAVLWAVKEDVTKGTTNTTFSPDANCTRAQIVTFIWRCKK